MRATREEQMLEAVRRLQVWQADEFAAEALEKGTLAMFERFYGFKHNDFIVLACRVPDEILEQIREIEGNYGILTYMVVKTETEFGVLYDLIYVGRDKDDWEIDAGLMEDSVTMSYCINSTIPEFSEFGTIGLGNKLGGMYRTQ